MTLWFVVPVHGRAQLTAICLRQLRRTCDALTDEGIEATAVVIGDDENLGTARDLGFGTVERDNQFTSRKFNDGIQLACDPTYNPRPADYVVPFGSDDWADYRIFLDLPESNTVLGFQHISFVREDGREMTSSFVNYVGGCGIRVYPWRVLARTGFRPADENRPRGCDTSILLNTRGAWSKVQVAHRAIDPRQIVDWKSPGAQLNSYEDVRRYRAEERDDPFVALAEFFPSEALDEMQAHYCRELVAA